jgi:hypothetical protein
MRTRIPAVILVLFVTDAVLGLLYLFNQWAGEPFWKLTQLVRLDGEKNLPTWYSSIQLFLVAVLLGIFALRNFSAVQGRSWLLTALPVAFLALSLDEIAQIHEWLGLKSDVLLASGSREDTSFQQTGIWMFVIGIPFAAGMLWLIYSIRRYFAGTVGVLAKFVVGLLIFLGGAIGLELLSNFSAKDSVGNAAQIFLEEVCEMVGVTVILWAVYDLLLAHGFSLHLDPAEHAPSKTAPH